MLKRFKNTAASLAIAAAAAVAFAAPVKADKAEEYAQINLIAVLYHEMGHALIDLMELPIYGREEDAADNFSVLMLDALYDDDVSSDLIRVVASSYSISAEADDEKYFWDVHGTNEQRFFNTLCIYVGGDIENRRAFGEEMGLPEERMDGCEEERDEVDFSWGAVLDTLLDAGPGETLQFVVRDDSAVLTSVVVSEEVDALNEMLSLPFNLPIVINSCGEANAFYSPDTKDVTMCTEFEDEFLEQAAKF